jgi:hypothetical protein
MTGGVNRLPPFGLIAFSVGTAAGGAGMAGGAAVTVTVFVTVSGAGASLPPQAVSTPMARIAPMPAVATRRRAIRPDLMMRPICIVNLNYIVQKIPRQRVDRRTRYTLSGVRPCRATDDTVQLFGAVKSWPGLAGSTIVLPSVFPALAIVDGIKVLAEQFNQSVLAMVRKVAERVSPADTLGNRRRRRLRDVWVVRRARHRGGGTGPDR